jgi:tRNA (guanine37-N1)-methyltransferase
LQITFLTLFPEVFPGPLGCSLSAKALKRGIWSYNLIDIGDFGHGPYKKVDDSAAGGGAGMVMRVDVLGDALDFALKKYGPCQQIYYMSPKGELLRQELAKDIANTKNNIIIICARFEGIDQRLLTYYNIQEISIGDFILLGGESAALVFAETCIRLLDGVVASKESIEQDSFSMSGSMRGLLEYPVYTRPAIWRGLSIPAILLSGHHQKITEWKTKEAQEITRSRRPDLWKIYNNNKT